MACMIRAENQSGLTHRIGHIPPNLKILFIALKLYDSHIFGHTVVHAHRDVYMYIMQFPVLAIEFA